MDDHIQVLHLLDGGVLEHLALVPLVCLIHLIPELVLDLGVGGQDVGDISEGQARRVVPGDEYDEGGGAQRYDVKVFVLSPKSVRSKLLARDVCCCVNNTTCFLCIVPATLVLRSLESG